MNPHQKNKLDLSKFTDEQKKAFKYGVAPKDINRFKKPQQPPTYFDSGEYYKNKAEKGDKLDIGSIGTEHPNPENIPHLSSPSQSTGPGAHHQHHPSLSHQGSVGGPAGAAAGSPVKESSLLQKETSAEDKDGKENVPGDGDAQQQGIPIRG
ncbi:camp-regulated phosphoprotein/endosulfine conserved region-domain-containing protein [Xylariaceae sp. FL0016]|nr:camp-regulated phosphoprotein/endosulfine conserved region-domain-containing protein [Xylariaceae sp. FL0016]